MKRFLFLALFAILFSFGCTDEPLPTNQPFQVDDILLRDGHKVDSGVVIRVTGRVDDLRFNGVIEDSYNENAICNPVAAYDSDYNLCDSCNLNCQ